MGLSHPRLNFSIRYITGSMSIVDDALSRIHEVTMLSFNELNFDIFDQLQWLPINWLITNSLKSYSEVMDGCS